MKHVCITGIGLITPLGLDQASTWQQLCLGRNAAQKISLFDANDWPVNIACQVNDFILNEHAYLPRQKPFLNRPSMFAMNAALEGMQQANPRIDNPKRFGVFMGTGLGAIAPQDIVSLVSGYSIKGDLSGMAAHLQTEDAQNGAALLARNHPGTLAAMLAQRWQAQGPVTSITTACAAGAQAIGYAARSILSNETDICLAGGADSLSGELLHAGFCLLGVLSKRIDDPAHASRPFDRTRDGFVASEGAAVLVLESLEHARQRNAPILATIVGYGESENAYRITDLPEDGNGAAHAMRLALADAHLTPGQITYINAHGTSTEQNDRVEAVAIEDVFYRHGATPKITSTKSQIGHFVAAAGAVEAAFCALSVKNGLIPATLNLSDAIKGKHYDLNFVTTCEPDDAMQYIMSNSFGFGGTNASLIFGSADDL